MRPGKLSELILAAVLVSLLNVLGCATIEGSDRSMNMDKPQENEKKNERSKSLKKLYRKTEKQAERKMSEGQYEDAIRIIETSIGGLRKSDSQDFPSIVALFYGRLAATHFSAAISHMAPMLEWQKKCLELEEKDGDLLRQSLTLSALARHYALMGNLKVAEDTHKKAIAVAEMAPPDNCSDASLSRCDAAFTTRWALIKFYHSNGRKDEARDLANELELLIENGQADGYFKEDIRRLFDEETPEKESED